MRSASGERSVAFAAAPAGANYRNLLVLIELKGGNDGLNTVVPYARCQLLRAAPEARDRARQRAAALGPRGAASGAFAAPAVLAGPAARGAAGCGLSRAEPVAFSLDRDLGHRVVQRGLSRTTGWLTRAFAAAPVPRAFAADGVIIGSNDLGPLDGGGTRAIALSNTEAFLRQARLAAPAGEARNKAYRHVLRVEADIVQAAANLDARRAFATEFPAGGFGNAVRTACQIIAQSFQRRGRATQPVGIRHAQRSDRDAGAAARRARAGHRRAQVRARRARPVERDADPDLRGVRSPAARESFGRHGPRNRQRSLRTGRTRGRRLLRRGAGARSPDRRRQRRSCASIFAPSTRPCWSAGGACPRSRCSAARFAPVPFLRA